MSGVIRRLLWRLRPPPEVRATRECIRETVRRVTPIYPLPRALLSRALALTRDIQGVAGFVGADRRPPDQVALQLLSSTVIGLLMSGEYHLSRGVLSGEGHGLVAVFTRCMLDLQERGYESDEKTEQALRRIRSELARLG
jgi:hypothetical protein